MSSSLGSAHSTPASSGDHRGWVVVVLVLVVAAIVVAAAIAYTAKRENTAAPTHPAPDSPTSPAPSQYSPAEQAAAKSRVCQVFDESTRGQDVQGGVLVHGQLNVSLVLRTVDGVVAIKDSLTPATPPEVVDAAKKYIDTSLDLTTGAMSGMPAAQVNQLNHVANAATDALSDVCGLAH